MILKCKNAFKEVGKKNPYNYKLYQECIPEGAKQKYCALSNWIVDKGPEGKNKSSDIQGLLAHAKNFAVSLLLLFLEKRFSYVVQALFLHTHPPRLQDKTTSPSLAIPSSAPCPPTHPDCLPQSITAVQALPSIHTLLLHSVTRELSYNLILGWTPAAAVAALLPLGNNVQSSIRWLWTESQKFSTTATPFLHSCFRCTWHTSHA